jgi:hypothetical protein
MTLVQAFLKKWWVESDFKAPNLPLMFQRRRFSETDQSETIIAVVAMFVNDRDKMSNPYREPSIDASYQVWFPLDYGFREED